MTNLRVAGGTQRINRNENKVKKGNYFEFTLLIVVIILVAYGLIMMYSASTGDGLQSSNTEKFLKKQIISTMVGVVFMIVGMVIPYGFWYKITPIVYIASLAIVCLVKTGLGGGEVNGATRWLNIGGMSVQPAEIVKVGLIITLAAFATRFSDRIKKLKHTVLYISLMAVAALVVGIITSNLSTAIILCGIAYIMLIVAKPNLKCIFIVTGVGVILVTILVVLIINVEDLPYFGVRGERVKAWVDPYKYSLGKGYQIIHSQYAIGSGGFFGKGLGNGVEKFFLPEAQNDMIFSVICEETGLFGALCMITLFVILMWRLMVVANNAKDMFGSMIVVGVLAHIALQFVLNIAVATNTTPNTGVTLPFISSGGSAIIFLLTEIGIVLNVASHIQVPATASIRGR